MSSRLPPLFGFSFWELVLSVERLRFGTQWEALSLGRVYPQTGLRGRSWHPEFLPKGCHKRTRPDPSIFPGLLLCHVMSCPMCACHDATHGPLGPPQTLNQCAFPVLHLQPFISSAKQSLFLQKYSASGILSSNKKWADILHFQQHMV